jgi:acyl-CoA reductase-like NAD-dependent aldehyde dehydrogenase
MVFGAYYQSGQSCISVQRIFVHRALYPKFRKRCVRGRGKLRMGDPKDERVFIGPMVDEDAAKRIDAWMDAAIAGGAKALVRGKRKGNLVPAALLENVPHDSDLYRRKPSARWR